MTRILDAAAKVDTRVTDYRIGKNGKPKRNRNKKSHLEKSGLKPAR